MKIAIVGSRDWPYEWAVRSFVRNLPEDSIIVSGGAAGVDSWAEDEAKKRGLKVIIFLPDWNTHGRSAGFKRNILIVNECDKVFAFMKEGGSRGTQSSIDLARKQKKLGRIFTPSTLPKDM